jgi:hypothetical protein
MKRISLLMASLIVLTFARNAHARQQGILETPDAPCSQEDPACSSRLESYRDRESRTDDRRFDLRAWLYDRNASEEPPAQRDDAVGSADLMVVHPAGNLLGFRW